VLQWCDGSFLEDQDTWWLSGIFRDVVLYSLPKQNAIEDYFVKTDVEHPCAEASDCTLTVQALLSSADGILRCAVSDGGTVISTGSCSAEVRFKRAPALTGSGKGLAQMTLNMKSPIKWHPSKPKLYKLELELEQGGTVIQAETWYFGVRDVRIRDRVLRLNGAPLLVNGVNRVEMHPEYGKAMPESVIREDLVLLKQNNFNAVRCAHCPNAAAFYRLCDELGLLVVDEANIECHGFAMLAAMSAPQCDPARREANLDRVRAMFARTKNHTCIIGWSLGNEAGMGPNVQTCADFLRERDPTRFVQYEGGESHGDASLLMGDGRHPVSDLVCPMYSDPERLLGLEKHEARPIVLCEYSHAMGNSNGALHTFYKLFKSAEHPSIQGGFIWDFADQGLLVPRVPQPKSDEDWYLNRHWGYGGDFGPKSGKQDSWFCCNGLFLPDRKLKPAVRECRYLMQPLQFSATWQEPVATVKISSSGYDDAHEILKSIDIVWAANTATGRVIENGTLPGTEIMNNEFQITLQTYPDGLWIQVYAELASDRPYAKKGHRIAEQTVTLIEPGKYSQSDGLRDALCPGVRPHLKAAPSGTLGSSVSIHPLGTKEWRVNASTYVAYISEGSLTKLTNADGVELLTRAHGTPMDFAFWRAPTDNDRGGVDHFTPPAIHGILPKNVLSLAKQWRGINLDKAETRTVACSWSEDELTIHVTFGLLPGKPLYRICCIISFGAKSINIRVNVRPVVCRQLKNLPTLPRVGTRFMLQPSLSTVSWLGRGPHECYPDRKASAFFNVHQRSVEEMHFPYIVPGECGGVADVQWVAAQDSQGNGLLVQYTCDDHAPAVEDFPSGVPGARPAGMCGAQVSVSHYHPHTMPDAAHDYQLQKSNALVMNIDTAHCGIGGTGGATEGVWIYYKQYYIDPCANWDYELNLTPLVPGQLEVERRPANFA